MFVYFSSIIMALESSTKMFIEMSVLLEYHKAMLCSINQNIQYTRGGGFHHAPQFKCGPDKMKHITLANSHSLQVNIILLNYVNDGNVSVTVHLSPN